MRYRKSPELPGLKICCFVPPKITEGPKSARPKGSNEENKEAPGLTSSAMSPEIYLAYTEATAEAGEEVGGGSVRWPSKKKNQRGGV